MTADAADAPWIREFLAAALRLAGVPVDDEVLAASLPLAHALLADWPLLTRAAAPHLEPMSAPRWPATRS